MKFHRIEKKEFEEIDELMKCIEDIKRWVSYRTANRIEFFTEKLMIYLKGGSDEEWNEFLGIAKHFKDSGLARRMYSIPEIRRLWTYKQEIRHFNWAKSVITKSIKDECRGRGFYEFYNNLRGGENYIQSVRKKFGNPEFARILEDVDEKMHEKPQAWEQSLTELSNRIHNPIYQNNHIIYPAAEALIKIFNERVDELKIDK